MEYAVVSFFASAWFFGWFKKNVEMNVCVIYASQIKIYCTYFRITFCIVDSTKETNLDVVFVLSQLTVLLLQPFYREGKRY